MAERFLPLAALEKLMKKSGAKRVSDDAKAELKVVLEGIADELTRSAVRFAEHAGRKTVTAKDIKLASKK